MSSIPSDGVEETQGSGPEPSLGNDSTSIDHAAIEAIHIAKTLNASLLLADRERAYVALKAEYDTLMASFNQQHATFTASCESIAGLQQQIVTLNEELVTQRENALRETRRSKNWEDKDRDSQERLARVHVEADSLRQEVSRLTASNNALNTQLVEIQTKSSLNSSSNAPLQYENLRLRSELDALTAHVAWMESELSTRTQQLSQARSSESTNFLSVSSELYSVRSQHEELVASHENLKIKYNSALKHLDSLQKQWMETEQNHSEEIHHLNSELTTERRLVALTKEQAARMEDRYNNVIRDMESMKMLAAAAEQDHAMEIIRMKEDMEKELHTALEEMKHNSEMEEIKLELDRVRAEKLKLEDDLIHHGAKMNTLPVADSVQRHWVLDESQKAGLADTAGVHSGPLSLLDLYDKLAAKEDELHSEKLERQRLELYLERIQKDIEARGPMIRQQRKEYEKALSQKKDMELRLHEVVEESRLVRNSLREKERESKEFEKECSELRLENVDLANQVQTLLRRIIGDDSMVENDDLVGFGSIDELQTQNQRLLREHHRLVKTVSDLESQLSNDSTHNKMLQAISELKQVREEREHQEILISGIVQQRDLYRALLVKTDAKILADAGDTDIGLDENQLRKLASIRQQKEDLETTIAKLNAELTSATNARIVLEEKFARVDAYAESLSLSMTKLQGELSAAYAATARSDAESSYCKQKLDRVEDDLAHTKNELARVIESRKEFMRLNNELQAELMDVKNRVSKAEQELTHNEVKLRLTDAQLKTAQAAELRLANEINSLRVELARQDSFIESMQRIETALSSRTNEARCQQEEEAKRVNDLLSIERSQHRLEVDQFTNKILSLEALVDSLQVKREEAISSVTELNKLVAELTDREVLLKKQLMDSQIDLSKANVRLDDMVDSSDGDMLRTLTIELNAAKDALIVANRKCDDYQVIAKSAESSLLELSTASSAYKLQAESDLLQLREQVEMLNRTAKLKQEALDELANDLSISRGVQENALGELQVKFNQVDGERQSLQDAEQMYKERINVILFELESSKADARSAKDNYERELALHSAAVNDARTIRCQLETLISKAASLERENESLKISRSSEAETLAAENAELQKLVNNLQAQAQDSRNLNSLLNSQLSSVSRALLHSEKERDSKYPNQESTTDEKGYEANHQINELQEIITLMRSEREMLESQLSLARRAIDREKSATEVAKRALEAARVELNAAVSRQLRDDDNDAMNALSSKVKSYDEQMKIMRDSNQLLRDEVDKLNSQLQTARQEKCTALDTLVPIEKERQGLEIRNATLEVEKATLIREVDGWKERVQSLVTKFHQIDPEEHAKALAQLDEVQKQLTSLQSTKESVEKENASAKSLVSRLNKEVSRMKSQVESLTANLELVTAEKELLAKTRTEIHLVAKERDDIKTAKELVENELQSTKIENEGNKSRIENLTTFLRKTKASVTELTAKLQQASHSEQEAKKSLAMEMDAHKLVLRELETFRASHRTTDTSTLVETLESSTSTIVSKPVDHSGAMSTVIDGLPQVPSEGFHFSPSPVLEQIFPIALDKASLPAEEKVVSIVTASIPSILTSNTTPNESLINQQQLDTSASTDNKVSDSSTVLNDNSFTTEKLNKKVVSSVIASTDEENTLKEKLLKRKRDKKAQALASKVLEPIISVHETETGVPSTISGTSNGEELLKQGDTDKLEDLKDSREITIGGSEPETVNNNGPSYEPLNSAEPTVAEKSDVSLNIQSDPVVGMVDGTVGHKAESSDKMDEASSVSNQSKKRDRVILDGNTEISSNKLPRLNQTLEDEKPIDPMDDSCMEEKCSS